MYPHQGVCSAYDQTCRGCGKRNHFQTACLSKDKGESRLDENEVFDDKSSDEDEKHTFSLSTKQSSKNKPFFFNQSVRNTCNHNEGGVRVCDDAVLRYFSCGFAEIFILASGIAVSQD